MARIDMTARFCFACGNGPCICNARVLRVGEVYCVACDSAPCVCGRDHVHVHDGRLWRYCEDCVSYNLRPRQECPKCGGINCSSCYFSQEEIDYYAGRPGPVFPARFTGRCKRCTVLINQDDDAQMINGLFGHPFQQCPIPAPEKEKSVSEIRDLISSSERRLMELYVERDTIESWGKDSDYPNETVLFFKQAWSGSLQYDYVAVKIRANTWYLTGKWSNAMGFEKLVRDHLSKAVEVWMVTAWEKVSK
jgi:hypothetical protein